LVEAEHWSRRPSGVTPSAERDRASELVEGAAPHGDAEREPASRLVGVGAYGPPAAGRAPLASENDRGRAGGIRLLQSGFIAGRPLSRSPLGRRRVLAVFPTRRACRVVTISPAWPTTLRMRGIRVGPSYRWLFVGGLLRLMRRHRRT